MPGTYWLRHMLYFLIYSVLGWILESSFYSMQTRKWVNRGFLLGPYLPLHGIAGLLMGILPWWLQSLHRIQWVHRILQIRESFFKHPLIMFVLGFICLTFIQYMVFWAMERLFSLQWLDCSPLKGNIHGRVCLVHALCWGGEAMVVGVVLQPILMQLISTLDDLWLLGTVAVFTGFMLADCRLSIRRIVHLRRTMRVLESLGEKVKEGIEDNQRQYEKDLEALLDQQRECQQDWRERVEEIKTQTRKDPYSSTQQTQRDIEGCNEELRANLRSLKEEMVSAANRRDEKNELMLIDLNQRIEQALADMKTGSRYKNLRRVFNAFPDLQLLSADSKELDRRMEWFIWDVTKRAVRLGVAKNKSAHMRTEDRG